MITKIIMIYAALMIATYIHELGHRPKKIIFKKWKGIPLPLASAMQSRSRYGGLFATAALFVVIYFFNPPVVFLQLIGAVAFLHFVLYTFFGSFNKEPRIPKFLMKYHVFDDIPNRLWFIFIPLSIITYLTFKNYYITFIFNFL